MSANHSPDHCVLLVTDRCKSVQENIPNGLPRVRTEFQAFSPANGSPPGQFLASAASSRPES